MKFYEILKHKQDRRDSQELQDCIKETVDNLRKEETSVVKPGILLGKIQSGKTKAFIGVMAYAFDRGFDFAIVLTKGTKALARQTFYRIKDDFNFFEDDILLYDIMNLPENLTPSELKQKLIIIAKKEVNNLRRVIRALADTYKDGLKDKTLLIIDDEADYASISYRVERASGAIVPGVISSQIDDLRSKVNASDFIQVTATPYALYLQPETGENITSPVFMPKRPAFTILVPTPANYIGGTYYFEESSDSKSPAHYIYEEVPTNERVVLRSPNRNRFKVEDALTSNAIFMLRRAIVNFIVGATIRRVQEEVNGKSNPKYAFVIHTERAKATHRWQEEIIDGIIKQLIEEARANSDLFESLIVSSYDDLSRSVKLSDFPLPEFDTVKHHLRQLLSGGDLLIQQVNSERQTETLLDDKGQLKLRVVLNIFIGGQILDRGITVRNLIGFYYGRRPQKFQQDTVLQHARMYGYRSPEDLAVTRFYTTRDIYDALNRIHEFDEALREAIRRKGPEQGVVFIRTDPSFNLIPCSPNKILPSRTTTLRSFKRILPVGFNTLSKTRIMPKITEIDNLVEELEKEHKNKDKPVLISIKNSIRIIDLIKDTIEFEKGFEGQLDEMRVVLEYMAYNNPELADILLLTRRNRKLNRFKEEGRGFSNAPDTSQDEGEIAKKNAVDLPVLILIRQNGDKELNWRGVPFWWPVIICPKNTKTAIYASDIINK